MMVVKMLVVLLMLFHLSRLVPTAESSLLPTCSTKNHHQGQKQLCSAFQILQMIGSDKDWRFHRTTATMDQQRINWRMIDEDKKC